MQSKDTQHIRELYFVGISPGIIARHFKMTISDLYPVVHDIQPLPVEEVIRVISNLSLECGAIPAPYDSARNRVAKRALRSNLARKLSGGITA